MADDSGPAGDMPLANPGWAAWSPAEIARRLAGLRPAAVEWLRDTLARVHPGHAWLGAL